MNDEKKIFVIKAELALQVKPEDIDDIISGSLDGGITPFWCDKVEVKGEYLGEYASEQISRGGTLIFHDFVEEETYELDLYKFLNGLRVWIEKGYDQWDAVSISEIDTCRIDAIAADGIVQCALFGDIIYG